MSFRVVLCAFRQPGRARQGSAIYGRVALQYILIKSKSREESSVKLRNPNPNQNTNPNSNPTPNPNANSNHNRVEEHEVKIDYFPFSTFLVEPKRHDRGARS